MVITKFSSQLSVALHQATFHLRRTLNPAAQGAKNATEKIREFLAGFHDAAIVANAKIAQSGSQLLVALKKATLHLRLALNPLTERGKGAFQKIPELLANTLGAALAVNAKITKFTSQLFVALKEAPGHLRRALNPLTESGKNVVEKTRHLQEARRARENDLRELLASSTDAVVVTNIDRRFIAANANALQLFGVSEANITQFTIDAFVLEGEILHLDGNGLPFISREQAQGECKIRRLTGNLQIAEYIFVANFVPFRHLFIFSNIREWTLRARAAASGSMR
ncbi:MAG: PAS domain-containing protein [Candidatus Acidiferrum sp.]